MPRSSFPICRETLGMRGCRVPTPTLEGLLMVRWLECLALGKHCMWIFSIIANIVRLGKHSCAPELGIHGVLKTKVMKCIVEVISDTLSKPSPMPVSKECFETLRGGAKERTHQQKKHSSYEDELSEVLEKPNDQAELKAAPGWPEDGAGKMGAEEAKPPEGKGEWAHSRQEEEEMARAPQVLFRGGKSGEPEQEEQLSKEWEDAKRWSKMDQLAKELTAEKRLEGEEEEEEDPDRSMRLSFRARGYGFRGPGLQLRRGWRLNSREDSVEAGLPLQVRGYPEEKKEEEGSANRRPEVGTGWELAPGPAGGQLHPDILPRITEGTLSPWSRDWRGTWTGGAQETGKAQEKGRVGGSGHPGKLVDRQTGDRNVQISTQKLKSWRVKRIPEALGGTFV
uniref:Chromogranin-A n=1 Tax=Bos indicus x Bos taurus TaxID=30522 RepID=A0A4W2GEA0_BOBOX